MSLKFPMSCSCLFLSHVALQWGSTAALWLFCKVEGNTCWDTGEHGLLVEWLQHIMRTSHDLGILGVVSKCFKRILVMQTAMDESDIPPKLTSLFIANQASTCRMAASVRGVKVWLLVRVVRSKSSATARHLPSPCFITPRNPREIAVMINING